MHQHRAGAAVIRLAGVSLAAVMLVWAWAKLWPTESPTAEASSFLMQTSLLAVATLACAAFWPPERKGLAHLRAVATTYVGFDGLCYGATAVHSTAATWLPAICVAVVLPVWSIADWFLFPAVRPPSWIALALLLPYPVWQFFLASTEEAGHAAWTFPIHALGTQKISEGSAAPVAASVIGSLVCIGALVWQIPHLRPRHLERRP